MSNLVTLTIDGREVQVKPGTLIIEAARTLGIEIPTFCYDQRLKSVGACRMCLVEVEKSPKLIASCATPVTPGMVVHTNTPQVAAARKAVIEFLLINHPLDCPTCDKGGECPLQDLTYRYGPTTSRFGENKIRFREGTNLKFDDLRIGPEIWLNRNRCIMCYKCVRIARDLAGGTDIGTYQRGAFAHIDIPTEVRYANEFSGNTVEYCPVGALMSDSFRYRVRTWLLKRTPSVCWLCPDGCNITVEHYQRKVYRHQSRRNDAIDQGFLCDKGRYGFDLATSEERFLTAMQVENGVCQAIGYEEALAIALHRLSEQKPESIALLLDSALTNEDAFCASEFFATTFPGSAIAIASRHDIPLSLPPLSLGLATPMAELEKADLVLLVGCDLAVEHPIVGLRVKKLTRQRVPVYFVGSKRYQLGRFAVEHLVTPFGHEHELIERLAKLYSEELPREAWQEFPPRLRDDLRQATNSHIIAGALALASPTRSRLATALGKLANSMVARLSFLPDETNLIGLRLVSAANRTFAELIDLINNGTIKTLFVAGGDPVAVYPDREAIVNAFKKLEFLIYWGAYPNATADLATIVFPMALPVECDGSFVNIERRVQFLCRAYPVERPTCPLYLLFNDFKIELGGEFYYSAPEVFSRIKATVPEISQLVYGSSDNAILPAGPSVLFGHDLPTKDDLPQDDFVLTFADSVYHGVSGMTMMSKVLKRLLPAPQLLINSRTAARLGVAAGDSVLLQKGSHSAEFGVDIDDRVGDREVVWVGYSPEIPRNRFMDGFNRVVRVRLRAAKGGDS